MCSVAETDVFIRYARNVWSTEERDAFVIWIASNPLVGDVIPGTGGLRKCAIHGKVQANAVAFELCMTTYCRTGNFGF